MDIKAIVCAAFVSAAALGCSSGDKKAEGEHEEHPASAATAGTHDADLNKMRTGHGPGTGTGSASGTNTGTPGTGTGPGITSETGSENGPVANGTGTVTVKADTVVKRGKWPTQGDPFR